MAVGSRRRKYHNMTTNYEKLNDLALESAFEDLMKIVLALEASGVPLKEIKHVQNLPNAPHAPIFTYLMTPKQFDRIKKICMQNKWAVPNVRGILIDLEAVAHPLDSRSSKDQCTPDEALAILVSAYSAYSEIGMNKPKHAQAIVFNTKRKVQVGNTKYAALAVVEVCVEGGRKYLAPVTAYHATEAKIRNIK